MSALFQFKGEPSRLDLIHNTLKNLEQNLSADALFKILNKKTTDKKQLHELGYVYYTSYYGKKELPKFEPLPQPKLNLLELYRPTPPKPPKPMPTFTQMTEHAAPAHGVCDIQYLNDFKMTPEQMTETLRNIHPFEMMSSYYHNENVCDDDFRASLLKVEREVTSYFEERDNTLNQLLSGLKKCICLRALSNNAYHYAHRAIAQLSAYPDMQELLKFYVMSDLIHEWNNQKYESHLHMIVKYNELTQFVQSVLSVPQTFLSADDFEFDSIEILFGRLVFWVWDNLYQIARMFVWSDFPSFADDRVREAFKINHLKRLQSMKISAEQLRLARTIQVNDFLHNLQIHYHDPDLKSVLDRGIHHLSEVIKNMNQGKVRLNESTYTDLHAMFKLTYDKLIEFLTTNVLPPHVEIMYVDEVIQIMEKIDEINIMKKMKKYGGSKKNKMIRRRTKKTTKG